MWFKNCSKVKKILKYLKTWQIFAINTTSTPILDSLQSSQIFDLGWCDCLQMTLESLDQVRNIKKVNPKEMEVFTWEETDEDKSTKRILVCECEWGRRGRKDARSSSREMEEFKYPGSDFQRNGRNMKVLRSSFKMLKSELKWVSGVVFGGREEQQWKEQIQYNDMVSWLCHCELTVDWGSYDRVELKLVIFSWKGREIHRLERNSWGLHSLKIKWVRKQLDGWDVSGEKVCLFDKGFWTWRCCARWKKKKKSKSKKYQML